jgi:hypothetical protein
MKVREEKGRRRRRTLGSYRYEEPRGRTMVSSELKKIGRERARERRRRRSRIMVEGKQKRETSSIQGLG